MLIADPSGARLFASKGVIFRGDWKLVGEFQHPEGRMKPHEILTDRPGRVKQSGAPEMRAAMEPHSPVKTVLAESFARLLAKKLEAGLDARKYDRLVLVAPPSFLGVLRQHSRMASPNASSQPWKRTTFTWTIRNSETT